MDALPLKVPEVAEQVGISRAKVYELITAGALRSVKVGGCRRIRASDLHAFVDQLSESASSSNGEAVWQSPASARQR